MLNGEEVQMLIVFLVIITLVIWKSFVFSKVSRTRSGWAVLWSFLLPPPLDGVVFLWKSKC
jgi:hypothetical protein